MEQSLGLKVGTGSVNGERTFFDWKRGDDLKQQNAYFLVILTVAEN